MAAEKDASQSGSGQRRRLNSDRNRCGSERAAMGDGGSPSPSPPDRQTFERQLSSLNESLAQCLRERDAILGNGDQPGGLRSNKGEQDVLKTQNRRCRQETTALDARISSTKETRTKRTEELAEIEKVDMSFKDEHRLDAALQRMRATYQARTFTNAKEEGMVVAEINKLERNKKKIPRFLTVREEKLKLDAEFRTLLEQRKEIRYEGRRAMWKLRRLRTEADDMKRQLDGLAGTSRRLIGERHALITDYNGRRDAYSAWSKRSDERQPKRKVHASKSIAVRTDRRADPNARRPLHSAPLAAASAHHHDGSDSDDELEPFLEEKLALRQLRAWLDQLLVQLEPNALKEMAPGSSVSHSAVDKADSTDSNESLPGGLTRLRKAGSTEPAADAQLSISPRQRKRASKKSSKKASQPVSVPHPFFLLFNKMGLEAPFVYADIPTAVDCVTEKLAFFMDQTRLPDSEHDLGRLSMLSFTYPQSESDSGAWDSFSTDMSESMSVTGMSASVVTSPSSDDICSPSSAAAADVFGVARLLGALPPPLSSSPTLTSAPPADDAALGLVQMQRSLSDGASPAAATLRPVANDILAHLNSDEGIDTAGAQSKESSTDGGANPAMLSLNRESSGVQSGRPSSLDDPDSAAAVHSEQPSSIFRF